METIDINQALPQIEKLLKIASTGEEIIITKNNQLNLQMNLYLLDTNILLRIADTERTFGEELMSK